MAGQGYNHPATDSGVPAPAPAPPLTQLAIRVGGIDSGYLHSPASTLPDSTLLPAIFYSDFVARLDRRTLDGGQYRYSRAQGQLGPGDITSFLPTQRDWGSERDNRPSVLFQLHPPANRITTEPGYLFTPSPSARFPQLQVVIDDRDGRPLRNLPDLPIMISTKVEGWVLEAWMRLNLKMSHEDIIQRMSHLPQKDWAERDCGGGFKNTISGRRRDFRRLGRCLSWEQNTSLKSPFDKKVLEEVSSNPDWAREQTTQYLEDLDKPERGRLETLGKRKTRNPGSIPDTQGVDTASNPEQERRVTARGGKRRKRDADHTGGSSVDPSHSQITLDDIDWDSIEQERLARPTRGHGAMQANTNALPGAQNASLQRSLTRVDGAQTSWNSSTPVLPELPEENTMPLLTSWISPNASSSHYLLTGQALVSWLAQKGVEYVPTYPFPPTAPEQQDARLSPAMDTEERRQLFLALYPAILATVRSGPRQFIVDLSLSYANAYKMLQDQLVHASYLDDNMADLAQAELKIHAITAWTGEIGDFDVAGAPEELKAAVEGREEMKVQNAPYVLSRELQERASAQGMLNDDGSLFWPNKLVAEARFDDSLGVNVQLADWLD